jgi:HD superfamily phosphohydrolase
MKRIFDPIHHFIELEDAEAALLDTPPLQRLRRLRQLGLAYLAFPAAEHSRFTHSLGALAFGERVLNRLRRDSGYFADEADFQRQRRLLRASLLLHDVGHGPFSHSCEEVLGLRHEARTAAILALPDISEALARLDVDPSQVLDLISGNPQTRYPVLRELVSGPNLDADRMDYLLRDAYFTGVSAGRFDGDQLVASLRVFNIAGSPVLGVDGRGTTALEGFVLARYLMFASVYFHHTARAFERTLHQALESLWPDPHTLDAIEEFLEWDDFRVLDMLRNINTEAADALRNRRRLYSLVAEYNANGDFDQFKIAASLLRERYGKAVWEDTQEQLLHRVPLRARPGTSTVFVQTASGIVDAREASDLIEKLSGYATWRKLYVRRSGVNVAEARALIKPHASRRHARQDEFPFFDEGALVRDHGTVAT